jgi:O-antigen/teichoic acid export membrane protein
MRWPFPERWMRSSLLRHVVVIASGSFMARMIVLAVTPLLTRIFGPEAFGSLGVFNSALLVLTPLATLSLPVAIVLVHDEAAAANIAAIVLAIAALAAVLTGTVVAAIPEGLYRHVSGGLPLDLAPWLCVGIFSTACMQVAQQFAFRRKMYTTTARAGVYQSIAVAASKCGIGYVNPTASVLVGITAIAPAVLALQIAGARGAGVREHWAALRGTGLRWRAIAEHKTLVLFRTPQTLINGLTLGAPVFLLAAFDGVATAGIYVLAMQMLTLPSMLVGNAVASVFLPHMVERHRQDQNLARLLVKATLSMAAVAAVPFGLIILLAPSLFGFVFGSEWALSGDYTRYLAPSLFFGFINRPCTSVIPLLKLEGFQLRWEILTGASRITALLVGFVHFGSATAAIILFSAVGVAANAALIARVIAATRKVDAGRPQP